MNKNYFIGLCIFVLIIGMVSASNKYVNITNSACNDSSTTGNISAPYCTFTGGLAALNSGDVLCLATGEYNNSVGYEYKNKVLTSETKITSCQTTNPIITTHIEGYEVVNTKWNNMSNATIYLWNSSYLTSSNLMYFLQVSNNKTWFVYDSLAKLKNTSTPRGFYYDTVANYIYFRTNDSTNPNNLPMYISKWYALNVSNITGAKLIIENLTFKGFVEGIILTSSNPSNNVTIQNNIFIGGYKDVQLAGVGNITVKNNRFINTPESEWDWETVYNNPASNYAIYLTSGYGGINISNNNIDGYMGGIMTDATSAGKNYQIEVGYNTIANISDDAIEIEDYCNAGNYHHNVITNSFVGFSLAPCAATPGANRTRIEYNIMLINRSELFYQPSTYYTGECFKLISTTGAYNYNITHNTCYGSWGINSAPWTHPTYEQANNSWTNNIFYTSGNVNIGGSGLANNSVFYDYNLYYRSDSDGIFYYWNNLTRTTNYNLSEALNSSSWDGTWDIHSVQANPLFTNVSAFDFTPQNNSPACTMSSTGSYVGAVPCANGPPTVNLISPVNGTVTSDNTPTFSFNFTDDDSATANCSLHIGNSYCYQESANITNQSGTDGNCGLNYSGNVSTFFPLRWTNSTLLYDGNWSSSANKSNPAVTADLDINYRMPNNAIGAIWQVGMNETINFTLPQQCINRTDRIVELRIFDIATTFGIYLRCYKEDGLYYSFIPETYGDAEYYEPIYEEGIYWLMNDSIQAQNSSVINNTQTNMTVTGMIYDGNLNAYITCIDLSGNVGTSNLVNFTVATNPYVNIISPLNGSNTSNNNINITYQLLSNSTDNNISYYNISLLNSDTSFNGTIIGNNSLNLSYLWSNILSGYSPGTYTIKVDAVNSSGSIFATGNSSYTIVTNAILNVTAFGNGTALDNFTITLSLGNSIVTTSGSLVVGIFKNYTYTVTISDSGYAIESVVMNWSNDTNYLVFNLSALANSIYIVFRDQDNLSLLSGVNISLDLISIVFANNYSTDTSNLTINGLLISNYTLRYGASGYATRFYGGVEVTNQSTQNLTLYMILLSSSSNVTVTVIDQNANPVQDAVVKALKYDLSTNSYLLQEVGVTNVEGETLLSLTKFDEYYKFMVEYQGELKTITSPAYITSNSLTIQILLGSLVGQDYYHFANIFADLTFNTITDNFRLDYDDVVGLVDSVCLQVYTLGLSGEVYFNESCSVSASGTLLVSVTPVNGTTYLGRAYYFEDGVRNFLDSESYTYPRGEVFGKVFGLLLQVILTVFCAFLAVWSLPLAALLVPLSLVLGRLLHFNFFGWDAISAVVVVGLIIAYVTRKNNG